MSRKPHDKNAKEEQTQAIPADQSKDAPQDAPLDNDTNVYLEAAAKGQAVIDGQPVGRGVVRPPQELEFDGSGFAVGHEKQAVADASPAGNGAEPTTADAKEEELVPFFYPSAKGYETTTINGVSTKVVKGNLNGQPYQVECDKQVMIDKDIAAILKHSIEFGG